MDQAKFNKLYEILRFIGGDAKDLAWMELDKLSIEVFLSMEKVYWKEFAKEQWEAKL